jgi:hypothetical protein
MNPKTVQILVPAAVVWYSIHRRANFQVHRSIFPESRDKPMPRWFFVFVLVVPTAVGGNLSAAEKSSETRKDKAPQKALPLSGEVFLVGRCPAFLIPPRHSFSKERTPWVWYAPTLPGLPADT